MSVSELNAFSRRFDLIFVEMGRVKQEDVYWFLDFKNQKRYYTAAEITSKLFQVNFQCCSKS